MNREEYLKTVRKQIRFLFDRDSIEKELDQHLSDSVADLLEEGFSREDAERIAVEQMGDAIEVGKMLNQEHHPLLGYLWMISVVILFLAVIQAVYWGIIAGFKALCVLTPTVVENSMHVYPIELELDTSTHDVKIDNICQDQEGVYYVTYRAWRKWNYSRAGWSSHHFWIIDENGGYDNGAGYSSNALGVSEGYMEFTWPEDNILRLEDVDRDRIEINLEEYCDE